MTIFSSDDEKKVFEELTKIDTKLGKIYYSALVVLHQKNIPQTQVSDSPFSETTSDDDDSENNTNPFPENFVEENPDRIAQSAHSIRETLNVTLRNPKIISSASNLKFKTKVQNIADPQTKLPNYLQFTYSKLTELHAWFTSVSHHGRYPSEQEYLTKLEQFTSIMSHILTPHYEVIQEIDDLFRKTNPSKDDLTKLEFLMSKNTQSYNHFFTNAKSNWLTILVDDGKYFKNVPDVIKKDTSLSFPFWPESYYLEQIAAEKPEQVQKIISDIQIRKDKFEKNSTVLQSFVSAAIKMPPKFGKIIAKKAIDERWHDVIAISILERSLAELMVKLAEEEFGTSLELCNFLLDVTLVDLGISSMMNLGESKKSLRSYIDHYSYEVILEKEVHSLIDKDHNAVIQILAKKLSKAIFLERKNYDEPEKDPNQDISFVWRSAIEDHEQNGHHNICSLLVTGIRYALEKSESMGISNLKKSLNILAEHNYYIFRRFEIYFYGKHPMNFVEEINRLSIECFEKSSFRHEYYHMLKNCYPYLQSENKEKLLVIISKGPNFDKFRGNEDEFEIYKKHWRIEKLSPIIENLPEFQDEYDSLVKKYGKSNLSEFVTYHESFYSVTEPSDLSDDMTIEEVMEFLKSYKIPEGIFLEEDGTGRKFKELVEKNPEEYSKHANELLSCHGIFHYRFLDGLSKIQNKELNWESILAFCESIIIESPSREIKILDSVLDYCGDLLKNNLRHNSTGIPFKLREKVWKVLEKSIEVAPSDTIWSENYPDKNWDAMGISINSSVGRITHAIMQYSVWCYHELKTPETSPTELAPEVKTLLNSLLNLEQPQSVSIHAVLGFHFYNLLALDEKWTKSQISSIFVHDKPHTKAGNAAWDAYLFQQIYQKSFHALFDEYVYRIENLPKKTESYNDPQKRLAEQMGVVYLNGLDNSDKLLEIFLEKADSEALEDCMAWIGRTLKTWDDEKEPPKIDISKFLSYSKIKSNPSAGWLFLNPLMKKQERISLLNSVLNETKGKISPIYWVPEELELFAKEYPFETIECIGKIINNYQNSGEMYSMLKHFENIFQSILDTKHESAIEKMNQIINFLGSSGYDEFRKFL